jgi:hypothetical protein
MINETIKEIFISIQLGDVVRITDPTNESLNNNIFLVDYIDTNIIKILNVDTLTSIELSINSDKTIGNGTIKSISILSRSDKVGYARQNGLVLGVWVNIYFGGSIPLVLTGEITNLEEDMIEIKTFPDNTTVYINFDYKGIPLDIPIENIEIRSKPDDAIIERERENEQNVYEMEQNKNVYEKEEEKKEENDKKNQKSEEEEEYIPPPIIPIKDQIREFILKADQIQFGTEEFGSITQLIDVGIQKQRYSIEVQANDMLDDLLSTIPNAKRTTNVLNNIHTMIERFKQLRVKYSIFNEYGNIEGANIHSFDWKPLKEYFNKFSHLLYWILPVVKNIKKVYNISESEEEINDIQLLDTIQSMEIINNNIEKYKSDDSVSNDQNKYINLYSNLNPLLTPFDYISPEANYDIIYEKEVGTNITTIIDNLNDFYSSVVENYKIKATRFVIGKYNMGLTRLNATNLSGSNMVAHRVLLTNPDLLEIKSFLTLPEPTIRFSKINLPGTNILDKANLNKIFLNYWEVFNKKTKVQTVIVDDLSKELVFNENEFLKGIKNYTLGLPIEDRQGLSTNVIYERFINNIIPTIRILFNLVKKYIHGKLSVIDVVSYLEPFLVYSDDLTYKQYENIVTFLSEEITKYNKSFPEKHRLFMRLTKVSSAKELSFNAFSILNILTKENNLRENILEKYDFHDIKGRYSNSEILRKIIMKDYGNLYYDAISLENIRLMFSSDLDSLLDSEKNTLNNKYKKEEDKTNCKNYIVAKQYYSIDELISDNNVDIYFDKKFDNTKYSLLDDYQKELVIMLPEDFFEFLIKKLQTKLKIPRQEAEYLGDTLITGVKKVLDGQYAIIYNVNPSNETEIKYFVRRNNKWELDETVGKDLFNANQNILCNFQEKCLSVPSSNNIEDKCISLSMSEIKMKENTIKEIITEFDEKYNITKEEYEKRIRNNLQYSEITIEGLTNIEFNELLKYNNEYYKLGALNENEKPIVVSPYFKLRDIILGQQDFTKKQSDVIRFVTNFTREPYLNRIGPLGQEESIHWLYCVKTNVKLLPTFVYKLACAFLNDYENYNNIMELIVKDIGVSSDDGDTCVDKHSGYIIKKKDWDVEEGYDEGFKIKSRDVLEQDLGDTIVTNSKNITRYTSEQSKMIYNVVTTLSIDMGINIENQIDFIINNVNNVLLEQLPTEDNYKKKVQEMSNKGKNIPEFKELYNTFVIYFTLGMFLIAIQTSIPSIKTRKTFPGCVRSFIGYPIEGAGNLSSLQYISCVAYKVRSSIQPWSALLRKKETDIVTKLKEFIDRFLLNLPDVLQKMKDKEEYLLSEPLEIISTEHDISNWTQFLPPLVPIKIKNINNISSEFKNQLLQDLRSGARSQRNKILIIESKIIFFSLILQEKIQNIILKEKLLLSNSNNEPYLENGCCNETGDYSTIHYFEKRNGDIPITNELVFQLSSMIIDIKKITEAVVFSTKINTKNIYPSLSFEFSEDTIYLAFIDYCHYNTLLPVSENLIPICSEKPDYLLESDSLAEMIRKLKADGRNYNNTSFLRLLQIVSRENIININLDPITTTTIQKFRDLLESIDSEKDKTIEPILIKLLNDVMDTFDIASPNINSETKALNNFLIKANENLKRDIIDFIKKNKNPDKKEMKLIDKFLNTEMNWEAEKDNRNEEIKISEDVLYNGINFFKSYIQNFTEIFPNIILNNVDYDRSIIPKYWGLSDYHANDIKNIIKSYYEDLKEFYSKNIITNVLLEIQNSCKNIFILSTETPCFSSITFKTTVIKPIFDERTSKLLFEYYFLKILDTYMILSNDENMLVREKKREIDVDPLFSVDYIEDRVTMTDTNMVEENIYNTELIRGNKKSLRQSISSLLVCFIKIMNNHKHLIDTSYDKIMDRIFKLKEKEKNMFTDRLKGITDEARDVDTILKINKLGVWSKGLQKGLTSYVKENYDEERDFMQKMDEYENILRKKNKNVTDQNINQFLDDFIDEMDNEDEIEKEAYDMSFMNEDYNDGNFEGDELNEQDYDDDF